MQSFLSSRQGFIAKICGAALVVWCLSLVLFRPLDRGNALSAETSSEYFHLLVPASESNPNFCKTIFSAAVLDYPTPRIINWQRKFDDPRLIFGGSHIAKIEGLRNYLNLLGEQSDNELAVIVDGYDIWFQLRPSALIERYHAINRRANQRIRHRLGSGAELERIGQSVIFSSQKRCWPAGEDDPACFAVPFSDLPADIYGPMTDQDIGDEGNPYVKFRQRFLNSGMVMGPVGQLRSIFEKALEKANADSNIGSDQGVFASIFGEQEYQREVIRARHQSRWSKIASSLIPKPRDDVLKEHPTHHRMEALDGKPCEFGIGIDYRSELSQPTVFSENDLAWIRFQDSQEIQEKAQANGVELPKPFRGYHLQEEVLHSIPPFWTINDRVQRKAEWSGVPLYTNLWTGISPVAVHHNAHRDGLKGRLQTFWNETWYFHELRDLLGARAASPRMPVAVVHEEGKTTEWWGPIDERGGMRIENGVLPGDWLGWQDVCGSTEISEEVFRDRKGRWRDDVHTLDWNTTIAAAQMERWAEMQDPQT